MTSIDRRGALALLATTVLPLRRAAAQGATLAFATAGQGSAFLPYGQGIAKAIAGSGIVLDVQESKGSNENLDRVDASPTTIGCAFLGSALAALNGAGFAKDKPHRNVRALFPMYETAFMVAVLKPARSPASRISTASASAAAPPRGQPRITSALPRRSRASRR